MFSGSLMSPILAGFLVMCCVLISSANQNVKPGFKVRISQKGLDFFRGVGIQMLQKHIQRFTIPEFHGSVNIGVGDVNCDVTNVHIMKLSIPTASLTINQAARGLTLKTSGISLKVHGDWYYKIHDSTYDISASESGDFNASASSVYLSVTLRIGVDRLTGRPTISSKASNCYINIGGLDVVLHGGAQSRLHGKFDRKIEDAIKDALNGQKDHKTKDRLSKIICDQVNIDEVNGMLKYIIDEVNGRLKDEQKNLQVIAPVADVIELDYSLVKSPSFNGSITTAHKGEVYLKGHKTGYPLPVPRIPPDSDTSRMVFIWITEYLPNSAGYVLQNIGSLQYNVTPDNVPAGEKNRLNTSYAAFDFLTPQVNKMYPNMAMQINIKSTKAPVVKIASTGVQADLVGDFITYAILPNKTLAYLSTLSMSISAKVSVNFTGNNITWNIASCSATLKGVRSAEMPFLTSSLQVELGNTFYLNQLGAVGIPIHQLINLPDGFVFTNPVIYLGEGFLKIGTDLTYTP